MHSNTMAIEDKMASIKQKQEKAAELREQLAFSLRIKKVFPKAFEGKGDVSIRIEHKKVFVTFLGKGPFVYKAIITTGTGEQKCLSMDEYMAIYQPDIHEKALNIIRRHWETTID